MKPAEYRSTRAEIAKTKAGIVIAETLAWALFLGFLGMTWIFVEAWLSKQAHADPYAQLGGGCIWADQQSNQDEIEFGSECGGLVAAEGGFRWDLGLATVSLGGEAAHRFSALHGQNGVRYSTSADGNTLHATSLAINARAERHVWGPVSVYGMAGAGGAYVRGLGDSDLVPLAQGEGGLSFSITENITAGAGYRAAYLPGVELDGNQEDLSFRGAVGWLRWSFK